MFMGILYGPVAGFFCGGLGDMLGYTIAGKGPFFAVHWSIANGLMGVHSGARGYFGHKARGRHRLLRQTAALAADGVQSPLCLFNGRGILAGGECHTTGPCSSFFLPIFITDTLWAFILVPPTLQATRLLVSRIEMRTILAVYYLLITAVLATWAEQHPDHHAGGDSGGGTLYRVAC